MTNMLRKITTKTVFGGKGEILAAAMSDKSAAHPLYDIAGVVRKLETVETDQGVSIRLRGQFMARNCRGEEFASAVAFIPGGGTDMIEGAFNEGDELEFSFRVAVKWDETAATSYVYEVSSHIQQTGADRVANLLGSAPEMPALEAPKGKAKK